MAPLLHCDSNKTLDTRLASPGPDSEVEEEEEEDEEAIAAGLVELLSVVAFCRGVVIPAGAAVLPLRISLTTFHPDPNAFLTLFPTFAAASTIASGDQGAGVSFPSHDGQRLCRRSRVP